MARRILVVNGPNLNMLGRREPQVYGRETLADLDAICLREGGRLGLEVACRQSNHEGEIVTWIQEAATAFEGIVINPGAYSHTSIAILDAIRAAARPVIEVHLSNIHGREPFRHRSFVSLGATGVICGLGADGYRLALEGMARLLQPASH